MFKEREDTAIVAIAVLHLQAISHMPSFMSRGWGAVLNAAGCMTSGKALGGHSLWEDSRGPGKQELEGPYKV